MQSTILLCCTVWVILAITVAAFDEAEIMEQAARKAVSSLGSDSTVDANDNSKDQRLRFTLMLSFTVTASSLIWYAAFTLLDCYDLWRRRRPTRLALVLSEGARQRAIPYDRYSCRSDELAEASRNQIVPSIVLLPAFFYFCYWPILAANSSGGALDQTVPLSRLATQLLQSIVLEEMAFYWPRKLRLTFSSYGNLTFGFGRWKVSTFFYSALDAYYYPFYPILCISMLCNGTVAICRVVATLVCSLVIGCNQDATFLLLVIQPVVRVARGTSGSLILAAMSLFRKKSPSFGLLTHPQIHEVLLEFLSDVEVLTCRCVHPECFRMVLHHARAQVQDVLGQEICLNSDDVSDLLHNWNPPAKRITATSLFIVLREDDDDLHRLVEQAGGGPRWISPHHFRGGSPENASPHWHLRVFLRSFIKFGFPLQHLQYVDVSDTEGVKDYALSFVAECKELRFLNVSQTEITDESIKLVAMNCKKLRYLNARGIRILDETMSLLVANCPVLRGLELSYMTDMSLQRVAIKCSQLQLLNIGGTRITDDSLELVAKNCRELKSLDVSSCFLVDTAIATVAEKCQALRFLNVSWTGVTDDSIALVARHCPKLKSLDVSGNLGRVTDESIALLGANCPELRWLDVSESEGKITDESTRLVSKDCRVLLRHLPTTV